MHATTRMPIGAAFFVAGQQDVINIVKATRMPLVKWEKAKGHVGQSSRTAADGGTAGRLEACDGELPAGAGDR